MDLDLSGDDELIRRTVRDLAEGEIAPVAEQLARTKAAVAKDGGRPTIGGGTDEVAQMVSTTALGA